MISSAEVNRRIAIRLGAVPCDQWTAFSSGVSMKTGDCGHSDCVPAKLWPLNYCKHLPLVDNAKKRLEDKEKNRYIRHLKVQCKVRSHDETSRMIWGLINATAEQQARALLATLEERAPMKK